MKRALVTGAAGFIGSALAARLLSAGWAVTGVDNFNNYYDPELKRARVGMLNAHSATGNLALHELDIADRSTTEVLFRDQRFDVVFHLAAQAGVRHSLDSPYVYIDSNVTGFLNVLEGIRQRYMGGNKSPHASSAAPHLVYASSSSVYGGLKALPFTESLKVDSPVSLYAATKRANELMGHAYSHLFDIPMSAVRFFTVYGPWGRPDMAYYRFAERISRGQEIDVYGQGELTRDFTYIDDITEALMRLAESVPLKTRTDGEDFSFEAMPAHRVVNIGNNRPERVIDLVRALERELGVKAQIRFKEMEPGDVPHTRADVALLQSLTGFEPRTTLQNGIKQFVDWFVNYRKVN